MKLKTNIIRIATVTLIIAFLITVALLMRAREEGQLATDSKARASHNRQSTHNDLVQARLQLLEQMKVDDPRNYDLKVPIEFHGEVWDQHDQPVVGAKVTISLSPPNDLGIRDRTLFTGTKGDFLLTGISGKYVFVNIYSPAGYICGDVGHRGDYNYSDPGEFNFHVPNPKEPVVFRLWKYDRPEPLHQWSLASRVKSDGTVQWFDLDRGSVGGASLGVSIVDEMPGSKDEERQTMKVVAGPGCVLAETKDDPMFMAPSRIEQKEIVVMHTARDGHHNSGPGKFRFYFKTAGGIYAAVQGEVLPAGSTLNPHPGEVKLQVFQNPSGSRNLEYDPRLEIKEAK